MKSRKMTFIWMTYVLITKCLLFWLSYELASFLLKSPRPLARSLAQNGIQVTATQMTFGESLGFPNVCSWICLSSIHLSYVNLIRIAKEPRRLEEEKENYSWKLPFNLPIVKRMQSEGDYKFKSFCPSEVCLTA